MTTNGSFERRLVDWLEADSVHRIPSHLDAVLVRTAATRQRSAWSSPERWLPMSTLLRDRVSVAPAFVWLLALIALMTTMIGGALLVGAIRLPTQPAFGLATNGRLLVTEGDALRSYAADGTDPQTVATLPPGAGAPWVSPDGRRAAVHANGDVSINIIDLADGSTTAVNLDETVLGVGDRIAWSPDSERILFNTYDGSFEHLFTARADGTGVSEVALATTGVPGALALQGQRHVELVVVGWAPAGDRIAFVAVEGDGGSQGSLYVARPDGADVRRLDPVRVDTFSPAWSPDPTVERIAVSVMDGADLAVKLVDVESGALTDVGPGFWPTWSPDGSRLAYWHDGTVVVETAEVLAGRVAPVPVTPSFTTFCGDAADLTGRSFCGPASWSPDGTRLYAVDIGGQSLLSVMADGSGQPIVIPLGGERSPSEPAAGWQPIRP